MNCTACGAENNPRELKCTFCGVSLNNSTTRIVTDLVNPDDMYPFFVKKSINGEGKETLESGEVGLKFVQMSTRPPLYFISFSLLDKSDLFINLYAVANRKSFTWDGECQSLELKIIYNQHETINFNVNYLSYKDDNQLSSVYGNSTRVYFRGPFTKELLLKMLESDDVVLNIKAQGKYREEEISLNSENLMLIYGYYNNIYNSSIRIDDVKKYWSDKMIINLIKNKGLFLLIDKNSDLKRATEHFNYVEFQEWINSNKEMISSIKQEDENKRISDKRTRENNLEELKRLQKKLYNRDDYLGAIFFVNIFLSVGVFIYLWVNLDFMKSLIIILSYNVIFFFGSLYRTSTLEKKIKELEELVK